MLDLHAIVFEGFTVRDVLFGGLLPAVAAFLLFLPAAFFHAGRLGATVPAVLPSIGLGIPFIVSYALLFGPPAFPPSDSAQWLFYIAIAATLAGVADALLRPSLWLRASATLCLSIASVYLLLRPIVQNEWAAMESLAWIAGLSISSTLLWLSIDRLSLRIPGASLLLLLLLIVGSAMHVLLRSGSQTNGQAAAILTACLAGTLPLIWWARLSYSNGPLFLIVILYQTLLIAGHFFATLTPLNAILLLVAPHLAWMSQFAPLRRLRPAPRFALTVALVLIPVVAAQIVAFLQFTQAMSESTPLPQ